MPTNTQPANNQNGFVLVAVLWIVVVISLLVMTFTTSVRTGLAVTRTEHAMAQVHAIADAGIELAIAHLQPTDPARWQPDGRTYRMRFAGARLKLQIHDANGRLDINYAGDEQLLIVLQRATGSIGLGRALHAFIMAQRKLVSRSAKQPANKPGTPSPREQTRPLAFHDLGKLLEVPGMSVAILARLRRILTVYSSGKGINVKTAPAELLRLLPGVTEQQVARLVELRRQQNSKTAISNIAASLSGTFTADEGPAYTIVASLSAKGFAEPLHATATILIDKNRPAPYYGINWEPIGN